LVCTFHTHAQAGIERLMHTVGRVGSASRVGTIKIPAASAGAAGPLWSPWMGLGFGTGMPRIGFRVLRLSLVSLLTLAARRGERRVATQAPTPAALTPQRPLLPSTRALASELGWGWGRGQSRRRRLGVPAEVVAGAGAGVGVGVGAGALAGAEVTVESRAGLSSRRVCD